MRQAIIRKGKIILEDVPSPVVSPGKVLIKVAYSCISAGTEISSIKDSGKSLLTKAVEKPENIQKILELIKQKGLTESFGSIKNKINAKTQENELGKPTGYSVSGCVLDVGKGVTKFKSGDLVAAAGAGYANHADFVSVPESLVVHVPPTLDLSLASTVTMGAIALHGVRRVDLKLGEFCTVIGSGILGLISLQMLINSGVRTAAIDIDKDRLIIAKELGAEIAANSLKSDPVKEIENWTGGYGTDAVLFTATTNNNAVLSQAFCMCKRKGRVVLVGIGGDVVKREDMYQKEIDYLISTSYGPGRYDQSFEEKNIDYPYAYVRWTETRNMEEYLRLLNNKNILLDKLIDEIYPIDKIKEAYDSLNNSKKPLIVLIKYDDIKYPEINHLDKKVKLTSSKNKDTYNIAIVGAGNFASQVHLPNLIKLKDKFKISAILNTAGVKAKDIANKYDANYATSNINKILEDQDIDAVMICTRHNSHANLVLQSLKAGKHVFVEKPLATNENELNGIENFLNEATKSPILMVGFNRRFSKYAREIKKHTDKRLNPLFINYRMNAGYIPYDHWVHENGGRIVGEACHIIDLMTFLTGYKVVSVFSESLSPNNNKFSADDNKSIILKYEDGSVCNIQYFATGHKTFPKEYMEIHFDENTIVLDDYRALSAYGINIKKISSNNPNKGHFEELLVFYEALKKNKVPTDLWDIFQTTQTSFLL